MLKFDIFVDIIKCFLQKLRETCFCLLSSMGYFINKNHETDIICRRLSARIVETVNREFYELIGNMNNTKRSRYRASFKIIH